MEIKYLDLPIDFPAPLAHLLRYKDYHAGNCKYSVTELLKPPQIVQLSKRHEPPPIDPRENIYSVLGSAVHARLEQLGLENPDDFQLIEKRLFMDVGDVTISGQIDLHTSLDNGILTDWKHCKTSVLKYGGKEEWRAQLNTYVLLLRQHGYEVNSARVMAIFRDWSQSGYGGKYKVSINGNKITCTKNKDYPEWGCEVIPIELWPDEKIAQFILQRVELHEAAEKLADEELPECAPNERWEHPKYGVRKKGNVRATKSFEDKKEAIEYLNKLTSEKNEEYILTETPGVAYRCLFYCPYRDNCKQWERRGLTVEFE